MEPNPVSEIGGPMYDPEATAAPAPAPARPDLGDSSLYFNRELSWLEFNDRVLQLAEDESVPLLERVKFAAIYANNLDEFFMVRVAGLRDQVDAGIEARGPDGRSPSEVVTAIRERVLELGERLIAALDGRLRPALAEQGIHIVGFDDIEREGRQELAERFERQIFPVLTPLAVGLGRPFPYISNLSLSLAVLLRDPVTEQQAFARVKVPKEMLPRFVRVGEGLTFVPLEEVIARHMDTLFPGMEILDYDVFRVTRDADFTVSDEADDLLQAVEDELRRRRFGEVVRVEIGAGMNAALRHQLVDALRVEDRDVYPVDGLLDVNDLTEIADLSGFKELRDLPWTSVTQPRLIHDDERADVMAAMRQGDILVHHPYDSFATSVERFVRQAVEDPDVLAIKQTVYRTSDDSPLVPALIEASERGKQAVCLVELKARFDERANITWARALEEAGVHVVYGHPALKTHAKAILVVRREGDGVRHYVHIGTGNYHPKTARLYTDFGLFTVDDDIGDDVADMFNYLTGYARPRRYRKVLVAPNHLRVGDPRADRADHRGALAGVARAHPPEDERPGGPGVHRGALPRLAGGRARRPQHPRHLLPATGRRGRLGEHPRRVGRRDASSSTRGSSPSSAARRAGSTSAPPISCRATWTPASSWWRRSRTRDCATRSSTRWIAASPTTPTPGSSTRTASGCAASPGDEPRNVQRELMARHADRAAEVTAT